MRYRRPTTLPAALAAVAAAGVRPLAGGTDLLPRLGGSERWPTELVDLKRLPELQRFEVTGSGVSIGAALPLAQIYRAEELTPWPALLEACRVFAARQIRERATLGGNLANASPAADTVPPLAVYDAVCVTDRRRISAAELATAPGRTALRQGEIIVAIEIPLPGPDSLSFYHKLASRDAMAISMVGVAASLRISEGRFNDVRIALGAVAPTVIRALRAEVELEGQPLSAATIRRAVKAAVADASPIDDIRATARYRRLMIERLLGYHLGRLLNT